mgnify:CR=1 FL=1
MEINYANIYQYVNSKNIKNSNLGCQFLVEAISMGAENPAKLQKITSLYNDIGEKYNTSATNVDRTIRYSLSQIKEKNKEFIIKAINEMKYKDELLVE